MSTTRKITSMAGILAIAWAVVFAAGAAGAESLDELYKSAVKEGGTINFYGTLAQVNAEKILPAFEKRFPGIKINHIDATSDKLVARAVSEARGGRTIGDVFQTPLENVLQMGDQGLLLPATLPEAAEYPSELKGSFWAASDVQYFIIAWNTNLVKKEEDPKSFDDLGDPRWKNRLIAEPRDVEMLIAFSKHKFKSEEKAVALLRRIAANNVEFHAGHSQLAELLVAGQAAVCFTCYSHHFPSRIKKGAPLNYLLSEGVASLVASGIFKNAPHPHSAMLLARWVISPEGQKAYAAGGRTPANPKIEPIEKTRSEKTYFISAAETKEFPKYEKTWKQIFKLR